MNLNVIGGALGMAALVAIFVYGRHEPVQTKPVPAPAVVVKPAPAPAPVIKQSPAPVVKPAVPAPAPVPLPTPAPDKNIYHRVEHGGVQGPAVACKSVKLFAEGKSPAELAAFAKQYGVPVESLARYYVCN